jgi:hypothetical protein
MRYIINFQIRLKDDETYNDIIRSSYTILEKDSQKYNLSDITEVEAWFKSFFKKTQLDHFIDTTKLSKNINFDMKIGRITNAISGKYKTF